jgi:hypothetical protein
VEQVIELDRMLIGSALNLPGLRVPNKQEVVLSIEYPSFHSFYRCAVNVDKGNQSARGNIESGFNGAAVAEGDTSARVSADQTILADTNHLVAATR